MKRIMTVVLSLALGGGILSAQSQQGTTSTTTTKKAKISRKSEPSASAQLDELHQALDALQQQIKHLNDQMESRDQKIQQLEQRLDQSQAAAAQERTKTDLATAQTAEQQQTVIALKSDVTDLKTSVTNSAQTLQETEKNLRESLESPLAIRFKGITLTPGGFLAAETVYRNHALGSDINTPFNSVNMPGAGQNALSEFYGSGRQSRVSMLSEGKISAAKLSGYYEADFLSAGVTSNNNQSNSYTLRQRQAWGQAALDNGWSFTGGQMWSLVTETKKGVDNRTEAVPMTIDPAYTVGFSWARQWGFRVAKNFNDRVWLAASLENPQTIFAATGNAANFAFGSAGTTGGLYNSGSNYSFNATPDIILKAVFEPGFGHYEIFAIGSRFRDRVYPCVEPTQNPSLCGTSVSTVGVYNDSKNAGGVGANGRLTFFKQLDLGLHALYGTGIGRYGASGLPDATVNPDGTLAALRSYQGLATLEWHVPRFDLYLNGGEEYVGRHYSQDVLGSGNWVGYGSPFFSDSSCYTETVPSSGTGYGFGSLGSNCTANTRYTLEGTFGFWLRVYHGPKGRLQFGPQYSYLDRKAWSGSLTSGGAGPFVSPHGTDNMFMTSFRYYLP
jgi:hypothetical protein